MQAGGGQVMAGLGLVGRGELGDGFELDNDLAVDHEVCDVFADDLVLVHHGQTFLALEGDAAQGQLMLQRGLVDGFETCPELDEGKPGPRMRWTSMAAPMMA